MADVALEHRRFSIIDLTDASHQPLLDDKRTIALACNEELYTLRALRAHLVGWGIPSCRKVTPRSCCAATSNGALRRLTGSPEYSRLRSGTK